MEEDYKGLALSRRGNWMVEFLSDIGKKRIRNEDSIFVDESTGLIVLADGMGGLPCGDIASAVTVGAVSSYLLPVLKDDVSANGDFLELLREAAAKANNAVISRGANDPSCKGMGSTMVVGLVVKNTTYICNVGDSKCFFFRNELVQITEDHNLAGYLRKSGASPSSIPGYATSMLLQAIGDEDGISPFTYTGTLEKNDMLLFCTDGLTEMVSNARISEVLSSPMSLKEKVEMLVVEANHAGGNDNITVAIYHHGYSGT